MAKIDTAKLTCSCCNGTMPMRHIWEKHRMFPSAAECCGHVDTKGRCPSVTEKAWREHDRLVAKAQR